eukprot:s6206_g1.t1
MRLCKQRVTYFWWISLRNGKSFACSSWLKKLVPCRCGRNHPPCPGSKRQILCLQLLVEEARTMPVWTEPPPLSRRPVSTVEAGTPPSTPAASVNLTSAPSTATPGDPIELILSDLRKWKREIQDLATLSSRIQEATWYKELINICQEEWVLISGAPNSGKSDLAQSIATVLGLQKITTTSKLLWCFSKESRPHMTLWHWTNDSVMSGDGSFKWTRLWQSIHSVTTRDEFASGMAVIEGHRIFQFSQIREFITSTIVLVANVETLRTRGTSPESIEKYRVYIKSELDDSSSLLHGSNVALFPAETHRTALVCSVLEKIVLNNTSHDSAHLSEIKPDGVNLL